VVEEALKVEHFFASVSGVPNHTSMHENRADGGILDYGSPGAAKQASRRAVRMQEAEGGGLPTGGRANGTRGEHHHRRRAMGGTGSTEGRRPAGASAMDGWVAG